MSGDEADFQSNLEDLESFVKLLSPIGAQSRETLVVDSARHINFDELQEEVISEMPIQPGILNPFEKLPLNLVLGHQIFLYQNRIF